MEGIMSIKGTYGFSFTLLMQRLLVRLLSNGGLGRTHNAARPRQRIKVSASKRPAGPTQTENSMEFQLIRILVGIPGYRMPPHPTRARPIQSYSCRRAASEIQAIQHQPSRFHIKSLHLLPGHLLKYKKREHQNSGVASGKRTRVLGNFVRRRRLLKAYRRLILLLSLSLSSLSSSNVGSTARSPVEPRADASSVHRIGASIRLRPWGCVVPRSVREGVPCSQRFVLPTPRILLCGRTGRMDTGRAAGFGRGSGSGSQGETERDVPRSNTLPSADTVYLDYAASPPAPLSTIRAFTTALSSTLYSNPHSRSTSSRATSDAIADVRRRVLEELFGLQDAKAREGWDVVWTSGATAALKLVAERFPWNGERKGRYRYLKEAHTSLVGVRGVALERRADVEAMDDEEVEEWLENGMGGDGRELFAYPAQCNATGSRLGLELARRAKRRDPGTSVLVDAAAWLATQTLQLDAVPFDEAPDFIVCSMYKLFVGRGFLWRGLVNPGEAGGAVLTARGFRRATRRALAASSSSSPIQDRLVSCQDLEDTLEVERLTPSRSTPRFGFSLADPHPTLSHLPPHHPRPLFADPLRRHFRLHLPIPPLHLPPRNLFAPPPAGPTLPSTKPLKTALSLSSL